MWNILLVSLENNKNLHVPSDYEYQFNLARLTFKYQLVYCPKREKVVHLNRPGEDLRKFREIARKSSMVEGKILKTIWTPSKFNKDDIGKKIAISEIDPMTRMKFHNNSNTPNNNFRKRAKSQAVPFNAQYWMKFISNEKPKKTHKRRKINEEEEIEKEQKPRVDTATILQDHETSITIGQLQIPVNRSNEKYRDSSSNDQEVAINKSKRRESSHLLSELSENLLADVDFSERESTNKIENMVKTVGSWMDNLKLPNRNSINFSDVKFSKTLKVQNVQSNQNNIKWNNVLNERVKWIKTLQKEIEAPWIPPKRIYVDLSDFIEEIPNWNNLEFLEKKRDLVPNEVIPVSENSLETNSWTVVQTFKI